MVQTINDLLRPVYSWSFITIHSRNKPFIQVLKHKNQPIILKKNQKKPHQLRPFKWLLTRQAIKNIKKFVMDSKNFWQINFWNYDFLLYKTCVAFFKMSFVQFLLSDSKVSIWQTLYLSTLDFWKIKFKNQVGRTLYLGYFELEFCRLYRQ